MLKNGKSSKTNIVRKPILNLQSVEVARQRLSGIVYCMVLQSVNNRKMGIVRSTLRTLQSANSGKTKIIRNMIPILQSVKVA
jgi:hypothetical protein